MIFERLSIAIPEPKIELEYESPYTLLVAVILSAQATDKMVNKITPKLFSVAKTPQQMCNLGEEKLKEYIKSINYFNNKAKNIVNASRILMSEYNSNIPSTLKELTTLPGIGRKSANVILNTIYGHATVAVDTHVFRVSNRLGLCNTTTPYDTEIAICKVIPQRFIPDAHHLLVLHGRYICKARKPSCNECTIADLCSYNHNKI